VVVGPSGCGRSSLVAAGLAPRLAADPDWLVIRPMVPGGRPVAALAGALAEAGRQRELGWDRGELAGRAVASTPAA
jgi:ribose 1,5-bisphosphokinase PhnN